jgi:colicin import membrane protein
MASAATAATRFDFHPPRPQGTGRAISLAMLAHLALLGALTWGVSWKREATVSTVEAELWSSLPQQAAPKLQETAPPPPPQAEKAPEPPAPKAPDISVEKEKPKPKVEPKPEAKPEPKPTAKPEPKPAPKIDKAAEDRKLAAQREKDRQDQMQRMAGLAGASGAATSQGTAQQSSGISTNYAARIEARVRPNHVFTGDITTNPRVEIEIRLDPTGLIQGKPRILKSSGNREFDESVVRAFEKTEILPRDENGRMPPSIQFGWSAKRAL